MTVTDLLHNLNEEKVAARIQQGCIYYSRSDETKPWRPTKNMKTWRVLTPTLFCTYIWLV